jgi:putative SOS response-associated peptidase YedK
MPKWNNLMCGRFNLFATADQIMAEFGLPDAPQPIAPRYNIAPTQPVAIVRTHPHRPQRELTYAHWGLIPSWARDIKMASRMINARSETAAEKPAYRAAFKRRRCLVPATGFYEWQKTSSGKQPIHFQVDDGGLFALAGLWEYWSGADGSEIESCTIMTTEPNELVRPIHNRMPVIVSPQDYELWLDPDAPLPAVQSILGPFSAELMTATPISTRVNSPRYDDATIIQPVSAE